HNFSTYFGDAHMKMMIAFIQKGMADTAPYIAADKTVKGDKTKGKTLYTASCTRCHGDAGMTIKFGDPAAPQFVGTIAADNPWEFFHKTLNGQPGKPMPSGLNLGWSMQDVADVLAYSQTMPIK
ncbi:MAG: cytochrome c, partial [Chloroflexi bacterium]|nr:cytochrome c [Chloroflexota bacterium]